MSIKKVFTAFGAIFALALMTGCWDKGSGEKIGSITRIQKTGVFYQTWEAEIIRGGLNSGSGVVGNAFHFTVESEELAEKVKQAMLAQQEVKITYREEALTWCRSDSNDYFLVKIEPLNTVSLPPTQTKENTGIKPAASQPTSTDPAVVELLKQNQQMLSNQQALIELLSKKK